MALLEKAIEKANKYISLENLLCYTAYKINEPIEDIVSYLLYNQFDELISEYQIDRHYRIILSEDTKSNKTTAIFNEISKDGFCTYMIFCNSFFDDCPSANNDSDFYTPIEIDFYYSIEDIQELPFIKELDLDLENANALDYTVNHDDMVRAKEPENGIRTFRLIGFTKNKDARDEEFIIEKHGEKSLAHNLFRALTKISKCEDKISVPTITQTEPKTDNEVIKQLRKQITELTAENDKLKAQLKEQTDTPADDNTLQTILDDSNEHYAPDLKHAIKLWIDLYINKGVGGGSHSAMANNWIKGNTGYGGSDSSPVKRLREITTPLKDFGGQRPKEVKK